MMKTSNALKIIDNLTSNDPEIEDMIRADYDGHSLSMLQKICLCPH